MNSISATCRTQHQNSINSGLRTDFTQKRRAESSTARATHQQALKALSRASSDFVAVTEEADDLIRAAAPLVRTTTQEISEVLEAVGYLLASFKLPRKLADFCITAMRAAHGLTGEANLIELSDLALGKRHFPELAAEITALKAQRAEIISKAGKLVPLAARELEHRRKLKETALARRIARLRNQLREWQVEHKIELVESVDGQRRYLKEGGYDDVPSRYRLNILALAAQVIETARTDRDYDRQPGLAFRRAADTVALATKRRRVTLPDKREISPEAILKQAKSWSRKYTDLFPVGSESQRGAARVILEWAVKLAAECGAEIPANLPLFLANPVENQQLDYMTLFASGGMESEKIATAPQEEEQYQKIETFPACVAASQCATSIDEPTESPLPCPPIGQPREAFLARATEIRQQSEAQRRFEHVRAAYESSLSLAEVEACNSRAPKGTGVWKQYQNCPACGGSKSGSKGRFNVNERTGRYRCHACGEKGKLRELWDNPPTNYDATTYPKISRTQIEARNQAKLEREAQTAIEEREKVTRANNLYRASQPLTPGSKAWDYIESRLPGGADLARKLGMRSYCDEYGTTRVVAPFLDQAGDLVATNDRRCDNKPSYKNLTRGTISQGVFSTPGAFDAKTVAIVDGLFDLLALYSQGVEAHCTGGDCNTPSFLLESLKGQRVLLAHDNDQPNPKTGKRSGDEAAARIHQKLVGITFVQRVRPSLKDWVEIAETRGLDALRAELEAALERACAR